MAIDIFYESLDELMDSIQPPSENTTNVDNTWTKVHDELNTENGTSDYCTWYLRVLTATYLKSDPERFYPYIVQEGDDSGASTFYPDIASYCQQQIEPMGKECTMVQVLALAEYFQVQVTIEVYTFQRLPVRVRSSP